MEQRRTYRGAIRRGDSLRRSTYGRSVRRACGSLLGFGLLSALLFEGKCLAQDPFPWPTLSNDPAVTARLTVRPYEMATATQTAQAGDFSLDSVPHALVYTPQRCVGARRCPLVVFLHRWTLDWFRPAADKYGILLLSPDVTASWPWEKEADDPLLREVDAAMKQVLQRFAVDPGKIAILGHCNSGPAAFFWGGDNLDVFSRVLVLAGNSVPAGVDPPNKRTEFFFLAGPLESENNFQSMRALRQAGHRVRLVVGFRGHHSEVEDQELVGRWLQESWAIPDPAARPVPKVVANPLPRLTMKTLTSMTSFWTSFQQEPDSIRTAARLAHLREVTVPVGEEQSSTVMVDMPALAAQYPSVATALKKAGLTAQQHEAYRVALLSALTTQNVGKEAGSVAPASVLAKNVAFLEAHPDELQALEATKMWVTP